MLGNLYFFLSISRDRTRIEYCAFPTFSNSMLAMLCYDAFLIRCKNVSIVNSNLNDTSFSFNKEWRVRFQYLWV